MKGVVLHGGHGTRLRPLTHTGPKQLIPVANKPISEYVIDDLCKAGVRDIIVVLGDLYPDKVKEYYGKGHNLDVELRYVHQEEPGGIAEAIGLCEDMIRGPFVVYLGDNLLKGGIRPYVASFKKSDAEAMVLLSRVKEPSRFGVARFEDDRLVELVEKPSNPPSNYALTGIYLFRPVIFDMIERLEPSDRGELEITDAIQMLIDDGYEVDHEMVDGWWKDTGTPEDILEANRLVLDSLQGYIKGKIEEGAIIQGRVAVEEAASVKSGALIRGPAIIGRGGIIDSGVYIGPYTSIGENVEVRRGEIENSIVMKGSMIDVEDRIVDSLVAAHSQIISNNSKPSGKRYILGERSHVEV